MMAWSMLMPVGAQSIEGTEVKMDTCIVPDAPTDSIVSEYAHRIEMHLNEKLITATEALRSSRPESSLTRVMADVYHQAAMDISKHDGYLMPDMTLLNIGGLRKDIASGVVRRRDIFELMPFDNQLVLLQCKGSDLMPLFDHVAERGGEALSHASMTIEDGRATRVRIGGEPIDSERTYTIATIDYLAQGGDGFGMLKTMTCTQTGILVRDMVMDYLRKMGQRDVKLTAPRDVRIRIKK